MFHKQSSIACKCFSVAGEVFLSEKPGFLPPREFFDAPNSLQMRQDSVRHAEPFDYAQDKLREASRSWLAERDSSLALYLAVQDKCSARSE